jgi:hypothetical protein
MLFSLVMLLTNPYFAHKVLLNSFIGSTMGLVRGYMFAKTETIKEKAHSASSYTNK